jgi:hypothetical protein
MTQEVSICDKCSSNEETAEIMAGPILSNVSAARI